MRGGYKSRRTKGQGKGGHEDRGLGGQDNYRIIGQKDKRAG